MRDITEADFANATWAHYLAELQQDELQRVSDLPSGAFARQHLLRELREHLGKGKTVLVHWAADTFIEKNQLLVEKGSNQYRQLCQRLMRAQIEALKRASERDLGDALELNRRWQEARTRGE
ncbi:hypothetical protein [Devosia sp. Naph2]|uniref:hypothetical protein n=1 Tax=Devosia polycyclovorans TaxID=3345148 RepID=UPI0035CEFB2E